MSKSDAEKPWGAFEGGSVAVVAPSYHAWEPKTVNALLRMMMVTHEYMHGEDAWPITGLSFRQSEGTYVHRGRERLAEAIIEQGFDWILWVDTDMVFPPDSLLRLLTIGEDIVGANYCSRDPENLQHVAIKKMFDDDTPSRTCVTHNRSEDGIEEVEAIGFGLTLTKTSVIENLPKPWFFFEWIPHLNQHVGEDVWFCIRARQHGHKIYVDHALSKHVRHIGKMPFENQHAWIAMPEEDREPVGSLELVEA